MIAPDRAIAHKFADTIPDTKAFQILADLKSYPAPPVLDVRLRQLKPDVVLLDLASDLDVACDLIAQIVAVQPPVQVIGLHTDADSDAIVRSLRVGASEFLHAPFDAAVQREALARIQRLRGPENDAHLEMGKVVVFSSAKPGSGASTLATQVAFALKKMTGKRVLLADFDMMGGTIAFALKVNYSYSVADAIQHSSQLDPAVWSQLTVNYRGIDILPAPEAPSTEAVEPSRLHDVLEYSRLLYDWVVLDLPVIFEKLSLLALSESDRAFLVSTSELPSLHLARRAVGLLDQLGFGRDRYEVIINRGGKNDGIGGTDLEKIFHCTVHGSFPNDYFSLHRVVTLGETLTPDCELGRAVEGLAGKVAGLNGAEKRRGGALFTAKPALSQT